MHSTPLKSSLLSLVPSLPLTHTHHKERGWRRKPESRNKHPLTVSPVNRRHVQKKDMSEPKYEPTTPDSGCDRCFSYWPTLPAVLRGWVIIFVTIFIDKLWCTNSIIMKKRCQSSSNNIQSYRFKSQETCKWKKKKNKKPLDAFEARIERQNEWYCWTGNTIRYFFQSTDCTSPSYLLSEYIKTFANGHLWWVN